MGQKEFEAYFQEVYGERWGALYPALQKAEVRVARLNTLSASLESQATTDFFMDFSFISSCEPISPQEIPRLKDQVLRHYVLDPASVFAAESLPIMSGDRVLDMCAAPGGKSLILAQKLFSEGNLEGELILNEPSDPRRERLVKVVQNYIPNNFRQQVWVKGKDGVQYGMKESETFDAVLLDAPCSGEAHIIESPEDMLKWSRKRTEGLAQKQYALLCSALMALKVGGYVLYSTCSISPLENDGVIQHLIKKKGKKSSFKVLPTYKENLFGFAEKTEHGTFFAPDLKGLGPMYVCLIQKIDNF